jgi:hypothetical protein
MKEEDEKKKKKDEPMVTLHSCNVTKLVTLQLCNVTFGSSFFFFHAINIVN